MEEERKKENSIELQKPNTESEVYSSNKKCDWIDTYYVYTHKQNQNSSTKIKYNRMTWQTKETKNCIYQNKTKAQTGKQN